MIRLKQSAEFIINLFGNVNRSKPARLSLAWSWASMVAVLFMLSGRNLSLAGGTWTALNHAPPVGVNNCLLLSDGTVIGINGGGQCCKLTPDSHGSYINGTWTTLTSMNSSRLFFSSTLLTNGNVYAAGGEYGGGPAEVYDSLGNVWNVIQPPTGTYSDAECKLLPNGNVLQSDSQSYYYIYNAGLNTMQNGGSCGDMNETCWTRLPNDNVLALTGYSTSCQHYVPSLNAWYNDNSSPVQLFGYGGELGPSFVLPNGNLFQVGATTNTAIYTPGGTLTSAGSWVAGPGMPNNLGAVDAPAAMMVNGNILLCIGDVGGFNGPCYFYEYNYLANNYTQVTAPGGGSTYGGSAPFGTSMLCLPDGGVLFVGGQNSGSLYEYMPSGTPLAQGQPSISSFTENADGSYLLTGVGLAGISAGAAYGDDEQMDSNYPLIRMTNSVTGNVYYGRTYGWSSTTIQNPNPVTTEFTLPQGLPSGTYSLVVVANGNASAAQTFNYAPPSVPSGLAAISGSNTLVKLGWGTSIGATAYNLKRSTSSTGYFATLTTLTGTTYTDTGLTNGLTYYYKIAAIGPNGPSSDSAAVSATPAGPPPVPTGLAAVTGANAVVPLSWSPSYGATSYNLKRATSNGGPYTTLISLTGTNFNDTTVTNGVTYYYVLTAVGPNGESGISSQVSATPQTPVVITWFKADAITGLANGAQVTIWVDSSGHSYTASQATTSQRPTYSTAAINGLPVVHFNSASSQSLTFNRPVQDDFTIFCVFRSTQGLNSGNLYWQGAGLVNGEVAGSVNDFGTCLFANGQVSAGTGNPDVAVNSLPNYNDGRAHLMTFRRVKNTGEVDLYMDGAFAGKTTGNMNSLTSPTKLALGSQQTGLYYLTGDLGEVKIYSSALSDADRKAQESALIAKWGITNSLSLSGNLLVNIDATTQPAGPLAYLNNSGSAGGVFQSYTNSGLGPQVIAVGGTGTHGALFDGNCMLVHNLAVNGAAQFAPPTLTSTSFSGFSVEAWVYEPTIIDDNPVVSWGTRGSCGGQVSCAYGSSASYGGLAMWCNDHGWITEPAAGQWHYLAWTLDTNGNETLYADGMTNSVYTGVTPNVDPNNNICLAFSHDNTAGSYSGGVNGGCQIIGRVRICDGILSSQQVANNYATEVGNFNSGTPSFLASGPLHRWSFTNAATASATGLVVTDIGSARGTTNQINGIVRNNGGTATFTGSQVTLSGGSSATAPYVDFTNALISVLSTNKGGSGQLTVEAWLTPQGAGSWSRLFECGNTTSGKITGPGGSFTGLNYAGLVMTPGGNQNQSGVTFPANYLFASAVTGNQIHMAMTWDDVTNTGLIKVYENGVQVASTIAPNRMSAVNDVNNWLGRSTFSSDANLQGNVSEFRIFNRMLSPAELMNDYVLGPTFAGSVIKWNGNLSGNWDVNTSSNWLAGSIAVGFANNVGVLFDDTLTGTPNVSLVSSVQPASVTVSNSAQNYAFSGSGGIAGSTGLNKFGTGALYLNETNSYSGLTLVSAGTLGGTGRIAGPVTIAAAATLAPGTASIGTLIVGNNLTLALGSSTLLRLSLDGGVTNNDKVTGVSTLNMGGALIVTNIGATPLSAGVTIQLFSANAIIPGFSAVTLPALSAGLVWNTNSLIVNGTIWVSNLTYTLTYNADPNGSISGVSPQTVTYGSSGSAVTAVANSGYAFTNWSDGLIVNPRTDSGVTSNINVTANFVAINTGALPSQWSSNTVGTITASTSATYSNGTFTVTGAGANISGTNDNFWFVNQSATNDCTLLARVVSMSSGSAPARAGVMMRETLASGALSVFMGLTPATQAQWVRRPNSGGNSSTTTVNGKPAPYWVKLARGTNTFSGYISSDGVTWFQTASVSLAMNTNYFIGLAVCSDSSSDLNTAVFDNVLVTNLYVPTATANPAVNPAVLGPLTIGPDAISFNVTGDTNTLWQLEESTDLQTWDVLQIIGLMDGTVQQSEADSGQAKRFLRLESAP